MFQNNQIQAQRDANGNLTLSSAKDPRDDRKLCWTEENRLAAVADGNYISHYRYDADGERVLKLWGYTFPMDVNAGENRFAELKEFTVYLSPYVVADVNGYTKHYYAGMERLCCRIGGGGLQDLHEFQVPDSLVKEKENANLQMLKEDLTCAGARAETKGLYFEVLNRFIENLSPEEGIYYYHPDHLGSASWITDRNGRPIQHMQYLPYGETKLDQRTSSYQERYTFSGKEKDSETGYYYFGARYYNSDLSLWLSVDPMADKYPSMSPYNYCAWNPVKLVDPDGRDVLPTSIEALNMIRNSVPEEAREYIQTDERGVINQDLINSYDCSSSNFNDLKELVNSGCTIEVSLDDEFNYISQDNSIRTEHMPYYSDGGSLGGYFDLSTGESGWYGQTQYPDNNAAYPSINDNVRITINKNLSSSGRTESFAHEFYGHAYIYANTGNASAASHGYGQQNTSETNLSLKNRIINAMSEVRKYATR